MESCSSLSVTAKEEMVSLEYSPEVPKVPQLGRESSPPESTLVLSKDCNVAEDRLSLIGGDFKGGEVGSIAAFNHFPDGSSSDSSLRTSDSCLSVGCPPELSISSSIGALSPPPIGVLPWRGSLPLIVLWEQLSLV